MSALLPGACIGIMGGGQLARMITLEARRMGYRVAVMDADPLAPAMSLANVAVVGELDDMATARRLASVADVITVDTEHVSAHVLETLASVTPVRPEGRVLRVIQDRLTQRRFLQRLGAPQPTHAPVHDETSLTHAAQLVGFPAVLKTRRSGYDGRGQARVNTNEELASAWSTLGHQACVLEEFVRFEREISVVLARSTLGEIRAYPVVENDHRHHVLHESRVPARVAEPLHAQAVELARRIAVHLDHIGVLAVELFITTEGRLLVNEIAPRTHNSGHFTWGACATSQFEQHVRAVCGLALGDTALLRPAVMLNVMGDAWTGGVPDWSMVLAHPTARLHLYEKQEPYAGRKMGHILILGETGVSALHTAEQIASALEPRTLPSTMAQKETT